MTYRDWKRLTFCSIAQISEGNYNYIDISPHHLAWISCKAWCWPISTSGPSGLIDYRIPIMHWDSPVACHDGPGFWPYRTAARGQRSIYDVPCKPAARWPRKTKAIAWMFSKDSRLPNRTRIPSGCGIVLGNIIRHEHCWNQQKKSAHMTTWQKYVLSW